MLVRPARHDDLAAVVDLWRRYELATSGAAESEAESVRAEWEAPGFDLAASARVLADEGALVGYAVVSGDGVADSVADPLRVGDGLEERLLEWLEAEGRARGTVLRHFWGAEDGAAVERFTRRGWHPARTSWRMRIELDRPTPEPAWPAGLTPRSLDPDRDAPEVHELVETAFRDIGDGQPQMPYEQWQRSLLDPARQEPELSVVAEQGGGLVAACLAHPTEGFAFVRQLAVPREHRGRGLGLALLHESFRRHAARGFPATVLGVDAANATGATELYRRAGMHVVEAFTRWDRPA